MALAYVVGRVPSGRSNYRMSFSVRSDDVGVLKIMMMIRKSRWVLEQWNEAATMKNQLHKHRLNGDQ